MRYPFLETFEMISTIPPGRCIQTQGTEPLQYGPEVYRSYWRLSSALQDWLMLVAQRNPKVIVEEGGAPAAEDISRNTACALPWTKGQKVSFVIKNNAPVTTSPPRAVRA
jgi:hypothetical protein